MIPSLMAEKDHESDKFHPLEEITDREIIPINAVVSDTEDGKDPKISPTLKGVLEAIEQQLRNLL